MVGEVISLMATGKCRKALMSEPSGFVGVEVVDLVAGNFAEGPTKVIRQAFDVLGLYVNSVGA
ncbi:hypothetical protein AOQ73_35010 [Bradyrhizobium pachyrhizi]|nr:hypothetical protein AOQ73_35010 [Bradyrhizobium pachyrhizi]